MENTALTVGQKYTFKKTADRGRPFVGTFMKRQGMYLVMETRTGDKAYVRPDRVTGEYSFKPYNTKRRASAQTEAA